MKKALLFCLAVLALVACTKQQPEPLTVMSYNIRLGVADDGANSWQYRRPATLAMLRTEQPAVFGVQEAYAFQQDYILDSLPYFKCVGVGRDDGSNEGEHMSVFYDTTRVSLLDWGTYWLSETPDEPSFGWDAACRRTATWTLLEQLSTGKRFYFVNTHLDHVGHLARKNGLAMVVDRIGQMNPEGYPMVLTGDFNVFPDDSCLIDLSKIMLSARYSATVSDTRPSFNGFGTAEEEIDYIWYAGFSDCTVFRVLQEPYSDTIPFISDHYPVIATLEF